MQAKNSPGKKRGIQMGVTAVLYLMPLTRSISFRPYLARVGGKPILAMLAEEILQHSGVDRLIVQYHYEQERELLEEAVTGTKIELRATRRFSELRAAAEIVTEATGGQIALLQLGCAFAPADLLRRMLEHHRQNENGFTLLQGVPAGCSMIVFETAELASLIKLADRFEFSDAESAMRRLMMLGDKAQGKIALQLHSAPFDFCASYGITPASLPAQVVESLEAEFRYLEKAVIAAKNDAYNPDSPAILCALKQIQIERETRACQLTARSALSPQSRAAQKPRILYLSLPSAFSGAEQALCSMIKFLDRERFEPLAITAREGTFAEKLRTIGAETICPGWEVLEPSLENFSYALSLYQKLQPSIIHLNSCGTLPFLSAALASGIPVVQHVRNANLNGFHDGLVMAKAIIAISEFLKREALQFPIREERIRVIYDEVDTEYVNPVGFSRGACRREFGLGESAKIVLMVARVVPNKRYDMMIDAAARIAQHVPGFKLVLKGDIYGDSTLHYKLQNRIHLLGLENIVRWIDFVPDIRKLMVAADVLALCSDREGLGSCVVEAMAMGLPVIVTNTGGTHEIVDNGVRGGYVVAGGDSMALAQRTIELLADPTLRRKLGHAGREFVRTHLDARISAQAVMEIYTKVLREAATA
jgi:glycosyltransferase involved in cell wall biosynthesis